MEPWTAAAFQQSRSRLIGQHFKKVIGHLWSVHTLTVRIEVILDSTCWFYNR